MERRTQPYRERAKVLASHLTGAQWGSNTPTAETLRYLEQAPQLYDIPIGMPSTAFTLAEPEIALTQFKKNKASGADAITNKMLQFINDSSLATLLEHVII